MTEIPEHLLKRSRDRRAAAGGASDSPGTEVATTGDVTSVVAAPVSAEVDDTADELDTGRTAEDETHPPIPDGVDAEAAEAAGAIIVDNAADGLPIVDVIAIQAGTGGRLAPRPEASLLQAMGLALVWGLAGLRDWG